MVDLTTWNPNDAHTSQLNIPEPEREQRNQQYAPVCP
jgi:hypothetical protein